MITATKEITDKKQLLLMKQKVEERLNKLGKNWGYIQQTAQIDAPVLQRFIDLKGITEDDFEKIMSCLAVPHSHGKEQKITPKEEKSKKITLKWDYEKFKDMVLRLIEEKGEITSGDIKKFYGKEINYWRYKIEKMEKEGLIEIKRRNGQLIFTTTKAKPAPQPEIPDEELEEMYYARKAQYISQIHNALWSMPLYKLRKIIAVIEGRQDEQNKLD